MCPRTRFLIFLIFTALVFACLSSEVAFAQCTWPCPLGPGEGAPKRGSCDFQIEGSWSLEGSVTQVSAAPGDTLTAYVFLRDEFGAPSNQGVCSFEAGLGGSNWLTIIDVLVDQGLEQVYQPLPLVLHGPQEIGAHFKACEDATEPKFFFALVVVVSESANAGSDWLAFWPEIIWPEQFRIGILCECLPSGGYVCASGLPVLPPEFLHIQIEGVATESASWGDTKARF